MQFYSSLFSLLFTATAVLAQNSICGSQIYQPGTGQCFNGQLCLYATNPSTGVDNIITFPCGAQCYDAAKYTCNGGVLVVATGTASIAALTSTVAQTQTQGATASATPIQSGAIISSQSRAASSAASSAAATSAARGASPSSQAAAAASSSAPATSFGNRVVQVNGQLVLAGGALLAATIAGFVL